MKNTNVITVLLGLLVMAGMLAGAFYSSPAGAAGNCGNVSVDCTTGKIPSSIVPAPVVVLPNATKTLITTSTNTVTTTDICTATAAANVCPITGTNSKLSTSFIPDLSATYIPLSQKAAASGVASLGSDGRLAQLPSGAAPVYANPTNPTALRSTKYSMFGLGSAFTITPMKSGNVRFSVSFYPGGVGSRTNSYRIAYGTDTPPANGKDATGTVVGGTYTGGTALAAPTDGGVSSTTPQIVRNVIIVRSDPGLAVWFDLQGAMGNGNSNVSATNVEGTLEELPF